MTVIEGKAKAVAYYRSVLDREWRLLSIRYRGVKPKLLYTLLVMMNYKLGLDSQKVPTLSFPLEQDLLRFRLLLRILDEFLRHKQTQVEPVTKPKDLIHYVTIIEAEFCKLGVLRNMFLTVAAASAGKFTSVDTGQPNEWDDRELELAYELWVNHDYLDGDWIEYYYRDSTEAKRFAEQVKRETRARLRTTQQDIYRFSLGMSQMIKQNRREARIKRAPFLCTSKDHILSLLGQTVGPEAKVGFLKEMEYTPGRSWSRSPFVTVKYNRETLCVPLFSAFDPINVFTNSWLDYVIREVRGSSALGMMGQDWGKRFERYVRDRLHELHPHLKVDTGNTVIDSTRFPDIRDCLLGIRRTKIEIDIVAFSERKVYLISCKAPDQFRGSDMIQRFHFLRAQEFETNLEWDLEKAGEIEEYARCVSQSASYLEPRGFTGREVVPVLVTSDFQPLSVPEIRAWMLRHRTVPSTLIIQAKRLSTFPFD